MIDKNQREMEKNLKELDKVQKHWENKLDKELKNEEEITQMIDNITASLYLSNKASIEIDEQQFLIGARMKSLPAQVEENGVQKTIMQKQVILIVTNVAKYNILGSKYMPATVRADYDERYDAKANIRTAVEGWVRHHTGTIKPEMIE